MAAITSTANGDWNVGGTWTGGVVPGEGDTVTITHTVTLTADVTIGADTTTAAIAIGAGGTLQYLSSASADVTLTLKGDMRLESDTAKFEVGTVANPIPSTRIFTLALNKAGVDGDYGVIVGRNSADNTSYTSTFRMKGAVKTYYKNVVAATVTSGTATLTTTDSTGWKSGDVIYVPSTTRTYTQWEKRTLSGDASGTSITVTSNWTNTHTYDAAYTFYVLNVTRNVRVINHTASDAGYMRFGTKAIVDIDWTSFKGIGAAATNKRGLEIQTTVADSGDTAIRYCAFEDSEYSAISFLPNTKFSIKDSVVCNCLTTINQFSAAINQTGVGSAGSFTGTLDHCYVIGTSSFNSGIQVTDVRCVLTNLYVSGAGYFGIYSSDGNPYTPGTLTWNNWTAHSNNSHGIYFGPVWAWMNMSDFYAWHNSNSGINIYGAYGTTFTNFRGLGNNQSQIAIANSGRYIFDSPTLHASTAFSTGIGLYIQSGYSHITVMGGDIGTASGIKTTHLTADVSVSFSNLQSSVELINTKLGSGTEVFVQTTEPERHNYPRNRIRIQRKDQTNAQHKTVTAIGDVEYDATTGSTALPCVKMTPKHATLKLECDLIVAKVLNGGTATVTAKVLQTAAYNGAAPRLRYRRNDAIGITADGTIDTHNGTDDVYDTLTGTTPTATDDGVVEVYVDCDGTAGIVRVDDWNIT